MNKTERIFVAGHTGLMGSALVRGLQRDGFCNLLVVSHADLADLELTDAGVVDRFFDEQSSEYVVPAAGEIASVIGCAGIIEGDASKPMALRVNCLTVVSFEPSAGSGCGFQ